MIHAIKLNLAQRKVQSLFLVVLLLVSGSAVAQDQIVFVTNEGSRGRDLILSSPDGKDRTRITQWDGPGHYPHFNWPAWSNAADRLAFMADVDGHDRYSIWTSTLDGGARVRVTPQSTEALYPAWSPDGSRIAFAARAQGTWEIFVIDADGSRLTRITKHREGGIRPRWGGFSSWSPDGSTVYHHTRIDDSYSIYKTDVESGITRVVEGLPSGARYPAWSRSGEWFAFLASAEGNRTGLYITRADGADRQLIATGDFTGTPAWSTDESAIATTVTEPSYNVAVITLSSASISLVTNSAAFEGFPVWVGETARR